MYVWCKVGECGVLRGNDSDRVKGCVDYGCNSLGWAGTQVVDMGLRSQYSIGRPVIRGRWRDQGG